MRFVNQTGRFHRDVRKMIKSGKNIELLEHIVKQLAAEEPLLAKLRDHALGGNWKGHRECHITPDWLLIYKIDGDELTLVRTGSHSELF